MARAQPQDGRAMPRLLEFASAAVPDGALSVASFSGVDALSGLSSYELELLSTHDDLDLDALLATDAWLGMRSGVLDGDGALQDERQRRIHGVLARVEQLDRAGGWTRYRATLVPRLWRATLGTGDRVFLDRSVPEMVGQVLREAGYADAEIELRLSSRAYPKREYTVQHGESDFQFASRLLEHEGISYHFSQRDDRCVLVLGDAPEACDRIDGALRFALTAEATGADAPDHWNDPEAVHALASRRVAVPASVVLQDRDWRNPRHDPLGAADTRAPSSHGETYLYGEHHRDADAGALYARIRAEEAACRQRVLVGRSDVRALRAGAAFTLGGHPRPGMDGDYLVTRVEHRASQQLEHGGGTPLRTAYANEFRCIPLATPFRPERATPRPRIAGSLTAVIDAAGGRDYAELDAEGRYRVRLPLDRAGRPAAQASRPVRMAQPFAGAGMGMHFPLHHGTEVLLTHVNGDPDRPIISGAVPDALTPSVVAARNRTQCVLRSGGGNELRFEDTAGAEEAVLIATRDHHLTVGNDRSGRVGHDDALKVARHQALEVGGDRRTAIDGALKLTVGKDATHEVRGSSRRMVEGDDAHEIHGQRQSSVRKDAREHIGGSRALRVEKDCDEHVHGERRESTTGRRSAKARSILLQAEDEIVLKVGAASITMKKDGSIVISGGDLSLKAAGLVKIRAARDVAIKGAKLVGN